MANRRMIAGDIFEDDFIGGLTYFERLLWIGLITTVADDQGRMMDNPALIRSKVFLFDQVKDSEVETAINKICTTGKVVRYVAGTKHLVQIINWWKYQTPAWASPSKYPAPDGWTDRAKYHAPGNKIITSNWDKIGGYVVDYVPVLHSAIEDGNGNGNGDVNGKGDGEECAAFISFRNLIETHTGVMASPNDIKAIDEIIAMGAVEADIVAGIDWLKGQGKTIRYYTSIVGPTKTAMQRRIQDNGNSNEPEKYTGMIVLPSGERFEIKP